MHPNTRRTLPSRAARAALAMALATAGCGLDQVTIPELSGPSELGTAVKLTATPDVITADGFSTSIVQAQVFDQNGNPVAGRSVLLALADDSLRFADIGTLYSPTGSRLRAAEAVIVTDASGVATAVYTAPPRTDATADQFITVAARPVGSDANGIVYRTVKIELKSAEPRLFPPGAGGSAPTCSFIVEAPENTATCSGVNTCSVTVNSQVLFQSTSSDSDGTIVRYQWFFGDGTGPEYAPDQNHVFRVIGGIVVTHIVTDNGGLQAACQATITVTP